MTNAEQWDLEKIKRYEDSWWLMYLKENTVFDTEGIKAQKDWLIEQAERVRESEKKVEYYGDEHCRIQNLLAETAFENKRLRAAIKQALGKCKWNNEESARILDQALEGEQ